MEPQASLSPGNAHSEELPVIQLRAFTLDGPQHLMRRMPGALAASGAWIRRHDVTAELMRFLFEFERSNGMNVYAMLVGFGLELTRSSHLSLTSFCQRTLQLSDADALKVATCELEIREMAEEAVSEEPLLGASSST